MNVSRYQILEYVKNNSEDEVGAYGEIFTDKFYYGSSLIDREKVLYNYKIKLESLSRSVNESKASSILRTINNLNETESDLIYIERLIFINTSFFIFLSGNKENIIGIVETPKMNFSKINSFEENLEFIEVNPLKIKDTRSSDSPR